MRNIDFIYSPLFAPGIAQSLTQQVGRVDKGFFYLGE